MGYIRFFLHQTFYRPVPYPVHKKSNKKSFKLLDYLLKVKKFQGDSVKNSCSVNTFEGTPW